MESDTIWSRLYIYTTAESVWNQIESESFPQYRSTSRACVCSVCMRIYIHAVRDNKEKWSNCGFMLFYMGIYGYSDPNWAAQAVLNFESSVVIWLMSAWRIVVRFHLEVGQNPFMIFLQAITYFACSFCDTVKLSYSSWLLSFFISKE